MALFIKQKAEIKDKKRLILRRKLRLIQNCSIGRWDKNYKSDLTEIEYQLSGKRSEILYQTEKIYNIQKTYP